MKPARKPARSSAWISYHLYYAADPDTLLANAIWPLVQHFRDEQLIRQFFFIRYEDEQGPHIRLRLLPDQTAYRRKIMRQVKTHFPAAKFAPYKPETERYGGPAGLPIAEGLFEASSLAALRLIAGDPSWSHGRALASAMQLHLGMLQAFGLSRQEVTALWAHLVQKAQAKPLPGASAAHFEQSFAAQRQTIAPHLMRVWEACEQGIDFKEAWFTGWRVAMAQVGVQLRQAQKAHTLYLVHSSQHDSPLWCLYESYLHMTNNRLGLRRPDESLLAVMLHRSLQVS